MNRWLLAPAGWLFLVSLLVAMGCAGDDDDSSADADDDASPADDDNDDNNDDNDDATPECDETRRPVVFVHGFLEVGDAFATQAMRLASNGYCLDRVYAFDYNTLFGPFGTLDDLERFIDDVLAETGATQVELLGHSLGGAVTYQYVAKPANTAKVAHYVLLASYVSGPLPAGLPTLNLSSTADTIAGPSTVEGAENVTFDDLDHLQVATSAESFAEFYPFFNDGEAPATTEVLPEDQIKVSGRVVVFGLNSPVPDLTMQIFAVDPATGERLSEAPAATVTTGARGHWRGFTATPGTFYEFVLNDPDGKWPPLHYYREPFVRSNNLVYFRALPPKNSLAGLLFRLLPLNDQWPIFAFLNLNQAVVYGRDTFTVDGINLATPEMTDPSITTIAVFFFDANYNGVSDLTPAGGIFSSLIFLRGFDLLLDAAPPRGIPLVLNGREMNVRNWPSKTGGLSIALFE